MGLGELVGVVVGVFLVSLSLMLALVVDSSPSMVFFTNNVQSSLSVLPSAGFFISFDISVWRRTELFSILWISSLFVCIAAESRESPASFSAAHHVCICSLVGFVPGNVNLMFIWKAFGTTFRSLRSTILARFCFSNSLLVCFFQGMAFALDGLANVWSLCWLVGIGVGGGRILFVSLWDRVFC